MRKIVLFDTKPYDKIWFNKLKEEKGFEIKYVEGKLNEDSVVLAKGYDAVCAFVNDEINKNVINKLAELGIQIIAMRCAGYNNVDFKEAYGKVHVVRVPKYSPYAVAEFSMGLLMTLNRNIHRAYNRTRDFNYNINGLTGSDLHGKTIGVIGTGKIGQCFINICKGLGMKVLAYDVYPVELPGVENTTLDEIYAKSDYISLHCPLSQNTLHMINKAALEKMKPHAIIINTSRGALIDSEALLDALINEKIGGAALDVYEEEENFFFEDCSNYIIKDKVLTALTALPNVLITSHQAFLTNEALEAIANTTLNNLNEFFNDLPLENEICYRCVNNGHCDKTHKKRCF